MAVDMDFVLDGSLSRERTCQSVLRDLLALGEARPGLLKLSNDELNLHGFLALVDSRYVIGAQILDTAESGYTALRKLLSLKEGHYCYNYTNYPAFDDTGQTFRVDLQYLITLAPNLPEQPPSEFASFEARSVWRQIESRLMEKAEEITSINETTLERQHSSRIANSFARVRKWESKRKHWRAPLMWLLFSLILAGLITVYGNQLYELVLHITLWFSL